MVALFENSPELAVDLLRWLQVPIPPYVRVRSDSAALTEFSPRGHQADVVVVLEDAGAGAVLAVVVEIQRGQHRRKRYTWPLYQDAMRARLGCPVELVVIPMRRGTARWVRRVFEQIEADRRPLRTVDDADVPVIVDLDQALQAPARAVFSAVWYGGHADADRAALIAFAAWQACKGLERGLGTLYFTMINRAMTEIAARKLEALMAAAGQTKLGYFEKKYRDLGREEGRVATLSRLLELKFGTLPAWASERMTSATSEALDTYERRLLKASSLAEVFAEV